MKVYNLVFKGSFHPECFVHKWHFSLLEINDIILFVCTLMIGWSAVAYQMMDDETGVQVEASWGTYYMYTS